MLGDELAVVYRKDENLELAESLYGELPDDFKVHIERFQLMREALVEQDMMDTAVNFVDMREYLEQLYVSDYVVSCCEILFLHLCEELETDFISFDDLEEYEIAVFSGFMLNPLVEEKGWIIESE